MPKLVKHVERNRVNYHIDLERKYVGSDKDRSTLYPGYLDVTDVLRDANRAGREFGYEIDKSPQFAHELMKAMEYVDYVVAHATVDNLYKFDIPRLGYRFIADTQDEGAKEVRRDNRDNRRVFHQPHVSKQ